MKIATFQYKCRQCGEIYSDGHISPEGAMHILIATVNGRRMSDHSVVTQPNLIGLHSRCKEGYGVSDLIGSTQREA